MYKLLQTLIIITFTFAQSYIIFAQKIPVDCPQQKNGKPGMWGAYIETKKYFVKICDSAENNAVMIISEKQGKTLLVSMKSSGMIATSGKTTYQIVTEGYWNQNLEQEELIPTRFIIIQSTKKIANERVIKDHGGWYSLP